MRRVVRFLRSSDIVWKFLKTKKLIIYECQYLAVISPDEKSCQRLPFSMIITELFFFWLPDTHNFARNLFSTSLFNLNLSFTYACMSIPLCSVSLFQNIFFSTYLKVSRTSLRPTSIKLLVSINLIFK